MFDGLFNGLMYSFVLFISLVVAHALLADPYMTWKKFYMPKICICVLNLALIWAYDVTETISELAFYKNHFKTDPDATKTFYVFFYIYCCFVLIYITVYAYYLYGVIMQAMRARQSKQRFTAERIVIILGMSLMTVLLSAFPFKSKIFRFVS